MSEKDKNLEIPTEGSLGILAFGDIAIEAWRKKRGPLNIEKEVKKKAKKKKDE